jgi:dTDP-4-dehydrorhamnose reductase
MQSLHNSRIEYAAPRSKQLNIKDFTNVKEFLTNTNPDWIINCAAYTNVEESETSNECMEVNTTAVANLAYLAKKNQAKLVHISTDYVFNGEKTIPYCEADETNPLNQYGFSKHKGELEINSIYPDGSYIVRTSWLYGPRGKNFVRTFAELSINHRSAQVIDDQEGTPTYSLDLAEGLIKLLRIGPDYGTYHFSNSGKTTWFGLAKEIYSLLGSDPALLTPISSNEWRRGAGVQRPPYSVLCNCKWKSSGLGTPPGWRESLMRALPEIKEMYEMELKHARNPT